MNAVDTNVFVYAIDATEPVKQAKSLALLSRLMQLPSETCLLWQVAGEYVSVLRKQESAGRITRADVDVYAQQLLSSFTLKLPRRNVIDISLTLSSGIAFPIGTAC
jgi:predicted nucleic acid-binding protein